MAFVRPPNQSDLDFINGIINVLNHYLHKYENFDIVGGIWYDCLKYSPTQFPSTLWRILSSVHQPVINHKTQLILIIF